MLHYEAIEPKTLDLLKALAALPGFEEFVLVGGTGLALQLGHRLSIDLDFFTQDEFNVISAITSRGAKKDFFDITEILKHIPLEEALNLFEKKYPSAERFMAMKFLSWFEDAEGDPDPIVLNDLTWRKVKETIQEALRKIAFN